MMLDLPKSTRIVLDSLIVNGPMSPKEIAQKSKLAPRTVSFALRKLLAWKLLRRIPNLLDMRQPLYHVNKEEVKVLLTKHESDTIMKLPTSLLDFRKLG